ncbi:hypothetical protein J6590_071196 [Homalodisca vitripennis]|nr:hypothetical protein J6590_071196 [Homalodisca vitripennis]
MAASSACTARRHIAPSQRHVVSSIDLYLMSRCSSFEVFVLSVVAGVGHNIESKTHIAVGPCKCKLWKPRRYVFLASGGFNNRLIRDGDVQLGRKLEGWNVLHLTPNESQFPPRARDIRRINCSRRGDLLL